MYDEDKIFAILSTIKNAELDAPKAMLKASTEQLIEVCNGIGADWMSKRSRKIITRVLYYAEGSAAIHDWEYHNSDGIEDNRKKVDEDFLHNGLREVRYRYPQWYNPRRWLGERAVLAAHEVLSRTGGVAWLCAYAKKMLAKKRKK